MLSKRKVCDDTDIDFLIENMCNYRAIVSVRMEECAVGLDRPEENHDDHGEGEEDLELEISVFIFLG